MRPPTPARARRRSAGLSQRRAVSAGLSAGQGPDQQSSKRPWPSLAAEHHVPAFWVFWLLQKWSKGKLKEKVNNLVLFDKVSSCVASRQRACVQPLRRCSNWRLAKLSGSCQGCRSRAEGGCLLAPQAGSARTCSPLCALQPRPCWCAAQWPDPAAVPSAFSSTLRPPTRSC